MSEERLHVAQVKNAEIASRELRNQGFIVAFPTVKVRQAKGSSLYTTIRPMFPGYLLVAFDRYTQRWKAINSTRGVKRLICSSAGEPLAIPEQHAAKLFAVACVGPVDLTTGDAFFETGWREGVDALDEGDLVRITGGAYWGHTARVHRWMNDRTRIQLLLFFLGGTRVVTIPPALVEATS